MAPGNIATPPARWWTLRQTCHALTMMPRAARLACSLRPVQRSDAGLFALYAGDRRVAEATHSIPHPLPPGASEAFVALSTTTDAVIVEIRDNGSGGADPAGGTGLRGLADRVEALGGELRLESGEGSGTVIRAELPLR